MNDGRRAKAQELKAQGLTHREIAGRFGVVQSTVSKWLNPSAAREWDRRANAAPGRQEAKNEWLRHKLRSPEGRGQCPSCGDLLGVGGARDNRQRCVYCIGAEHDRVGSELERLWAAGLTHPEIARAMGWTKGMLAKSMNLYRTQGYDLPYRYKKWAEKAAA